MGKTFSKPKLKEGVKPCGGVALDYIPWIVRRWVLWSIDECERLKGAPGNTAEITVVFHRNFTKMLNQGVISAMLNVLYREDLYYTENFTGYSLTKEGPGKEKYELMSEKMARIYKGYRLDKNMRIVPEKETPVINLKKLVAALKSKDPELLEAQRWVYDGKLRMLDGEAIPSNKIALASFPRSGNTFMRKYFDLLTGVHTGADNTMQVNVMLQMVGMAGEDTVDDKCWVIKTHSPWCMPYAPPFTANKMVIIVRNPLDTYMSWLELTQNGNHAQKCDFDIEKTYPNYWDWHVKHVTDNYKKFHDQILTDCKKREVPMLFLRFEDMLMDPEPELYNIMRFLLGVNDLTGTNAERRIKEVIAMGHSATQGTYKLKQSTLKFNSQSKRYTEEQQKWVGEQLAEFNHTFGYAKHPDYPDNKTGFFEYAADEPMASKMNLYKRMNENNIQWVTQLDDEDMKMFKYQLSDPKKDVPLISFADSDKAMRAIQHHHSMKLYNKPCHPCD